MRRAARPPTRLRESERVGNTFAAAFTKGREFFDSPPDLVLNCAAAVGEQNWERMYDVNIVSCEAVIVTLMDGVTNRAGHCCNRSDESDSELTNVQLELK